MYERYLLQHTHVHHVFVCGVEKAPLYVIRVKFESRSSFISAHSDIWLPEEEVVFGQEQLHAAAAAKRQTGVGWAGQRVEWAAGRALPHWATGSKTK